MRAFSLCWPEILYRAQASEAQGLALAEIWLIRQN
jgi:hypothetical protein